MWFRFVIALGVIAPALLVEPRPWWQMLLISFAAFGAGRLAESGIDGVWANTGNRWRAAAKLAVGLAIAGGTVVVSLVPWWVLRHPRSSPPPPIQIDAGLVRIPHQRPGVWTALAMTSDSKCAIRADQTVWCWGNVPGYGNAALDEPQQIEGIAGATAIAVGYTSSCALVDTRAFCFGWNYDESLGVPATDTHDLRTAPVRVPIDAPVVAVSAGWGVACALTAAGDVWCWGRNDYAQVGVPAGDDQDQRPPTRVTGLPPIGSIIAGRDASCAIARDGGDLYCWGELAQHGTQTAGNRLASPVTKLSPGATAAALSDGRACVLARTGVACWGGGSRALHAHPELAEPARIAVGLTTACGLTGEDTMCWDNADHPATRVDGVPALVQIAVSNTEICGITQAGALWCW